MARQAGGKGGKEDVVNALEAAEASYNRLQQGEQCLPVACWASTVYFTFSFSGFMSLGPVNQGQSTEPEKALQVM